LRQETNIFECRQNQGNARLLAGVPKLTDPAVLIGNAALSAKGTSSGTACRRSRSKTTRFTQAVESRACATANACSRTTAESGGTIGIIAWNRTLTCCTRNIEWAISRPLLVRDGKDMSGRLISRREMRDEGESLDLQKGDDS
jgi:hypothetical protein